MDRDKIPTIASLMYDAQSEATSDWSEILDVEAEIILAVAVWEPEADREFLLAIEYALLPSTATAGMGLESSSEQ